MTTRIPYIELTVANADSPDVTEAEQFFMEWHVEQWANKYQRTVIVKHIGNGIRMYFNDTLTFTLFIMTWPKYAYSYTLTVYGDSNTDVI